MIKGFFLLLIRFYQRFLSPIKGFNCAHHRLHKGDTCSNAIKRIIIQSSLRDIPSLSRARFRECKNASLELAQQQANILHRTDLPCDTGCAGDIGCFGDAPASDCGNSSDACSLPCDFCLEFPTLKRRYQFIILFIVTIICLGSLYYYGSQISRIEISQLPDSQRNDSLFEKLLTRNAPSLRAVAVIQGNRGYSDIADGSALENGGVITLNFSTSFSTNQLTRLELQDARFSAAKDLIIVGQTLEVIEQPSTNGSGKRFKYQFKSRWGF